MTLKSYLKHRQIAVFKKLQLIAIAPLKKAIIELKIQVLLEQCLQIRISIFQCNLQTLFVLLASVPGKFQQK